MKKLLLTALFALFSPIAMAQVFQYYGPAAGIQKNTGSTYQNTSAASSDVVNLFSGCSGVLLLGADGSCHSGVTGAAGSTKDVQYNNSGSFAATNDFTWDATNLILSIGNPGIGGGLLTTPVTATGFGNAVLVQGGGTTVAGTAGDALIEGGSSANSNGGNAQLIGGAGQGTGGGGAALISGGHAPNATGGGVSINTFGGGTSGNASGPITISTGLPSGGGNSGSMSLTTGSTTSGTAGNISLATGASNGGGTSGSISITASHNVGGTDGGITLAAHGATVETIGAGAQIGAPTGGDCGVGCLNAQSLKINNVSVATNTAAGANTNVQYNSSGSFAGNANFTFDGTGALTLGPGTSSPTSITANPRTTGAGAGNNLTIQGGTGAASGGNVGGTAELLGGTGGATAGSTGGTAEVLGGTPGSTGQGGPVIVQSGAGGGTSGNSGLITINTGSVTSGTAGDIVLQVAGTTSTHIFGADGGVTVGAPTGSDCGTGCLNAQNLKIQNVPVVTTVTGSFTGTVTTGCTTTPTTTINYVIVGTYATVTVSAVTCTSNAAGFTIGGLPAALVPAACVNLDCGIALRDMEDNGTNGLSACVEVNSGTPNWTFGLATVTGTHLQCNVGTGFTTSGAKGFAQTTQFSYSVN